MENLHKTEGRGDICPACRKILSDKVCQNQHCEAFQCKIEEDELEKEKDNQKKETEEVAKGITDFEEFKKGFSNIELN
ncbi:MAG: hypothetical protein WC671_00960 [Candidatus Paceibacterota bacterium]|jgi:hypothetical protein